MGCGIQAEEIHHSRHTVVNGGWPKAWRGLCHTVDNAAADHVAPQKTAAPLPNLVQAHALDLSLPLRPYRGILVRRLSLPGPLRGLFCHPGAVW